MRGADGEVEVDFLPSGVGLDVVGIVIELHALFPSVNERYDRMFSGVMHTLQSHRPQASAS